MNEHIFPPHIPGMPQPTKGGMLFNLGMMVSPFVGLGLGHALGGKPGAAIGLFAGMIVACVGWSWFFFVKGRRGMCCETCGRPVTEATFSTPYMKNMGVMMSTAGMQSGHEGLGDKCVKCGRIFCTNCAQDGATCKCGSARFQTVRLLYR